MKTAEEILGGLREAFAEAAIKEREGGGGKMFRYVSTDTVIRRLNNCCNTWSFEVLSWQFLPGGFRHDKYKDVDIPQQIMMVHGRLAIPELGTRDGFGVQRLDDPITNTDDLLKAARGDALKTAAVMFLVAIDLYGLDLEDPAVAAQMPARLQQGAAARPAASGPARQAPAAPTRQSPAAAQTPNGQPEYPYPKTEGSWNTQSLVNWMRQQGFDGATDFPSAISEANRYGKETFGVAAIVVGTGDWNPQRGEYKIWPSNVVDALSFYFEKEKQLNAMSDAPAAAPPPPAQQLEDDIPF